MIRVEDLCYRYNVKSKNSISALKNINFMLENSTIMGIIGKTGSGKSTLAQLLCGLLSPTDGKIFLDEKEIIKDFKNTKEICSKVTMAFQYPENQLFEKTVYDEIAFGPRNKGIPESEVKDIVFEVIKFTNLSENMLECSPLYLSGGEKRKCAIASVMALKSEVLILDEPTAGLDCESKTQLMNSIFEYHQKEKNILIIISHNMEETARICDKVLVLDEGIQLMFDSPVKVFKNYQKLENLNLDVPQTSQIMRYINNKYPINTDIMFPYEAEEEILKTLKSKALNANE